MAADLAVTYELRVDGLVFEVRIQDGHCTTREGPVSDPDAVLTMDVQTLHSLLLEGLAPAAALAVRRVQIGGDPARLDQFVALFGMHSSRGPQGQRGR